MSIEEKLTTIAENEQKVYDAGAQREYDRFWDIVQQSGNRRGYRYAFSALCLMWNDNSYNPKYPIVCSQDNYSATSLFQESTLITDTKVPIVISGTRADNVFHNCRALKRIPSLTFENLVRFSSTFTNCGALEELNLYGTLDIDGFNVQWSTKLSKASFESVIGHLSMTTSGLSVTFSKIAIDNAFETSTGSADGSTSSEWAALANTRSNWTINLV